MRTPDTILGIDPGSGGSICYFKNGITKAVKMPMDAKEMQLYFQYIKSISTFPLVFIEKLSYRTTDRNIPGRDYQIQKMLSHYERLCTTMKLTGISYIEVYSVTWQAYLQLKIKKKEEKDERKRRYRDVAQQLYPQLKTTLWNADAILLMHFGRKKLQFDNNWITERLPENYKRPEKYLL